MTGSERVLRALSWALFAVSVGFIGIYLYAGLVKEADFPFTTNSVAKDFLLAGLALLVARDVRRFASIGVPLIVAVHLVMPAVLLATAGHPATEHTLDIPRWPWLATDLVVAAAFTAVSFMAVRSRYGLRYLWPTGYRALTALAEVLVDDAQVAPDEVGARADAYLASFRSSEKLKVWVALQALGYWPLLTLRPPFHLMSPATRRAWVRRRFDGRGDLRRSLIRTAQQFSFMGYYSDERAARECGYIPFSQRSPDAQRVAPRGLTCITPDGDLEADVVIVGTGAAGAMLAHDLADLELEVLLLERGSHVDPSTFTENEADQLARLYRDGALTLSKDFRFQVAQGMCVGGSTVVNNAVCFDLPDAVRDRWNEEFEAGLDPARLADAFRHVRRFLRIAPLAPAAIRNPGAEHLARIIEREHPELSLSVVECNIAGCVGSGYCNIGCAYGKKLSALDWTLPEAQRKHPDAVRVLADCQVLKVGTGRKVEGRLADGRRVVARARHAVVLSAGALASSVILQRSGLGGRRVGRGLSFNLASPVTLDFEDELHSERGAQISHYYEPYGGVVLETWFNPIVTQSLFMPGWFDAHRANMLRYRHMTCLGVVTGTESNGRVKPGLTRGGANLDYAPTPEDFGRIRRAVKLACEIGLELGAERVMPTTLRGLVLRSADELARIDAIPDNGELLVNSAHPQGGNPISRDPRKGVVDEHFQVHGVPGLYVCDASVFPSSITVNPQLTVMALAAYAAEEITGRRRPAPAVPPAPGSPRPA